MFGPEPRLGDGAGDRGAIRGLGEGFADFGLAGLAILFLLGDARGQLWADARVFSQRLTAEEKKDQPRMPRLRHKRRTS